MTKKIFDDGVLEATLYENKWVFIRWIQNKHGRLQKRLIQDLNDMERYIYKLKLHGWYTTSEINHCSFHKLLIKFGCLPREVMDGFQFFIKPIKDLNDLHEKVGNQNVRI